MSTETPTVTATPEAASTEPAAPHQEGGAGREAAKYRTQLREAEGARDALAGQLSSTRRALAERVLTGGVDIDGKTLRPTVVGDLFDLAGIDVATLYGEDGALDSDALTEAARGLHATRPQLFESALRPNVGPYVPPEGSAPNGALGEGGMTWAKALRPE